MKLANNRAPELGDFFSGCLCDSGIESIGRPAARDSHPWCIRIVTVSQALDSIDIRTAWDRMVADSGNPDVLFQSPQWLTQLAADGRSDTAVAVLDNDEGVVGVVPLHLDRTFLRWTIRGRNLLSIGLPSASILGSTPLLPDDPRALRQLLLAIRRRYPGRCVSFRRVAESSTLAEQVAAAAPDRWLMHVTDDPQTHHLARLPRRFEEFLGFKGRKSRARLRQLLKLADASNSAQRTLTRCEHREQIDGFLAMAAEISRHSWQFIKLGERVGTNPSTRIRLQRLADEGLLRAYVLRLANRPCAFLTGYQFNGVFHLDELGFDRRFSDDSPGITLLLHVLRDLMEDGSLRLLSFGDGHAPYKSRFSNMHATASPILLLPATGRNSVVAAIHRDFLRVRALLRSWRRGNPAARVPSRFPGTSFITNINNLLSFRHFHL